MYGCVGGVPNITSWRFAHALLHWYVIIRFHGNVTHGDEELMMGERVGGNLEKLSRDLARSSVRTDRNHFIYITRVLKSFRSAKSVVPGSLF